MGVCELQKICELLVSDGKKLALDLAEVSFADEQGLTLLSRLKTAVSNYSIPRRSWRSS